MSEHPPKKEKGPEPENKEAASNYRDLARRLFASFRARPDDPKYTYEEQNRLAEAGMAINKKMAEENEAKIITKKPIRPGMQEIAENPRSRSAKLRVIEK